MAESRALRAVDAPCIGVPPVIYIFVLFVLFGSGDEVRDTGALLGLTLRSDIRGPAAEGGAFGARCWMASGRACTGAVLVGALAIKSFSSSFL